MKKSIALIVCLMLALTMFAGCSSSDDAKLKFGAKMHRNYFLLSHSNKFLNWLIKKKINWLEYKVQEYDFNVFNS